jgi:prolipoprotein diacylglyceryltransferase
MTTEKVFNIAFMTFAASILSARILYAILNPSSNFLNPLVFMLFPYYPGLSLLGGVGGGVLFLITLGKYKNLPTARLLDFFSVSFLSALPVGIIGYFLLTKQNLFTIAPVSLILVYIVLFFVFIKILLPLLLSGMLKDGTIGLIFLICFAVISFITNVIARGKNMFNLGLEDLILVIILYTSLVFLFRQEKLIGKIKNFKLKRN